MLGDLHMGWEHVGFLNWPVDPAVVAPTLPDGLVVDTYDGDAYLSVVPFTNVDVRPQWLPDGLGVPLPELNLRTYVRLADEGDGTGETDGAGGESEADGVGEAGDGDDTDGRANADEPAAGDAAADPMAPEAGVYFYSLDAEGAAGVAGARLLHHLPYYRAEIDLRETDDGVRFESRRRHPGARAASFAGRYGPTGEAFTAERGSLASFLTDRARYFTETPDGDLRYATVSHERWPLYEATVDLYRNDLFAANGFAEPETEPVCYYSPRVTTRASESRPVAELQR
ncbi:YqjF family protein [Halobaculum sp. MBLA0147]|uniref:YqjF family protein n=1 Tax=Halobaculum sp. MBLA0147 TaxID=3079934 RepID=UPI0035258FD4